MLFGRDAERSVIGGLLEAARASRSGALLVLGEAGVGKSALLADARTRATAMHVLSGGGVESEAQLPFVARRLDAEGIVMLVAAREGELRRFDVPELPHLRLGGLEPEAAGALLDRHAGPALSIEARQRLIEATGGNPLALLELPSVLDDDLLSGAEPLAGPLPVGARVERAFLGRVRLLPSDTQALLLVAAADDTGQAATVLPAAQRLGIGRDALDAAE